MKRRGFLLGENPAKFRKLNEFIDARLVVLQLRLTGIGAKLSRTLSDLNCQIDQGYRNDYDADWPAQLNWPNLFGRTGGWLVAAFMPPSLYKAA